MKNKKEIDRLLKEAYKADKLATKLRKEAKNLCDHKEKHGDSALYYSGYGEYAQCAICKGSIDILACEHPEESIDYDHFEGEGLCKLCGKYFRL